MVQSTDRNGTVHQDSYDVLGRLTSDAVTTLGTGVDGSVQRITYGYDSQGNQSLITSYNAASGGTIANQVQRFFNGLGQLTTEYQSHNGAVDIPYTPAVQYAYNEMSGGQNNSRLVSMTYPDGYQLLYNYNSGLDSTISRLSSLSDSTGTLESYLYLGLNTVVERDHPQTNVNLSYIQQPGDPYANSDGGDQYTGLDRFGRVIDQNWIDVSNGTTVDRYQYGYDQNSDVLYRQNLVDTAMSELYQYDNLGQLTSFQRGTLNSSHNGLVGSPSHSQSWTPDALGNFTSIVSDSTAQTRTANQQNEYTSISGQSAPEYDADGNLVSYGNGIVYVYDAWNRLVAVKNDGTVVASYVYDGLNRLIQISESNSLTDSYYSSSGQVLENYQGSAVTAFGVWSPVYVNGLVYWARGSGAGAARYYALQDANWNVTAWVVAGTVVERESYDPFGAVTVLSPGWGVQSGPLQIAIGFQGLGYDWLVALNFADNRVYNPAFMRWQQVDFIGLNGGVNDYEMDNNAPTYTVDPTGLAGVDWLTKGQYMWHWHHMLPQAVFTSDRLARHGLNLDINSAEFGWRLQGRHHIGEGGIHLAGWNNDWEKWFEKYERRGIKVTKEMVLKQLEYMKSLPKYKCLLALGKQATRAFGKKAAAKAAAKLAGKAGRSVGKIVAKRGGKAIPGVGFFISLAFWPSDVQAKGWVGGTANTVVDAIPVVGIVKAVGEIILGDFIPDLDEYDPEVYDAEETLQQPQGNHGSSGSMTKTFWGRDQGEVLGSDW